MNILYRYVARSVIVSTAMVLLTVAGLIFFINLISELRDIGSGDYGLLQGFQHALFGLPYNLYEFFPMVALLGGVFGLGILASNQELMVMRSSGVSVVKLTGAVFCGALVLIAVVTLFGEVIAPKANFIAESHKRSALNKGQAIATATGVWLHQGNNFLLVNQVTGEHHLQGITRYQFDDKHRLLASYYADSADYEDNQWMLHHLVKTSFHGDETTSQTVEEGTWDLAISPHLLNVGLIEPGQLSLHRLSKYQQNLVDNGLQAGRFQFEFWKRIFKPLTALVMILLAIPFVLSAPRSVAMSRRLFFGIILGFSFYILNAFLGQFSIVFQVSPFFAALLPTLLFAAVGYLSMLRIRI